MFLRASPEFHAERVETIVNGSKASEDLLEPSIGLSLRGSILGPQFMTYEAGATFFYSRLTGSQVTLRDQEMNYYFLGSLFPGRHLSMNLLARRYTDQLRDNLLLFSRNRFTEVGGELLLQEGERMPFLGLRHFRRSRVTSNEQTVALFAPCADPDSESCANALTTREFVEFSETNTETDLFLDKRDEDLQYHLGFMRTTYESKDFGYSTTTNELNLDVTRWLMARRLQVNLRGDLFRTTTENNTTKFLGDEPFVNEGGQTIQGLGLLDSSSFTSTDTSLGLAISYRGTRWDQDASYDWSRSSAEGLKSTQQEGNLGTTYRISPKTTLNSSYSTVRVNGTGISSSTQNLNLRLTRRMTPNLVFYVDGEAETIRNDLSNEGEFLNLVASVCGNGALETGEQCDDRNTTDGDGCSSTCRKEPTLPVSVCGDGFRAPDEQCDDGNRSDGDGCSLSCQAERFRRTRLQDVTLADIETGVDYSRRLGRFNTYSNLTLGAGRATLSPGGSGLTTNVEARFGVVGTAFQRINLGANLHYQNSTDASGYAPDLKQTTAQLIATRIVGRRLQIRARALATSTSLDRTAQIANLGRSLETPVLLDETQRSAEIGFVAFLPRATYASLVVGRQSSVNNVGRGDVENRFNYLGAGLTLHPLRHLEVVGYARIERGFELNDIQDDRDFIELDAIYHLRDWSFELGYTTNKYILATTDYEQKRIYFTVRREFGWRLR